MAEGSRKYTVRFKEGAGAASAEIYADTFGIAEGFVIFVLQKVAQTAQGMMPVNTTVRGERADLILRITSTKADGLGDDDDTPKRPSLVVHQ